MRVALVGPTHPYKGGIALHTTELAHRLAAGGHAVTIESWSRQYPAFLYPGRQHVEEPDGPAFATVAADLSWRNPLSWVRVGRRVARSADVVVVVLASPVQVPAYLVLLCAVRLVRRSRARPRIVVLAHNVGPHEARPGDGLLVHLLLRGADGVLVHSPADRDRAAGATRADVALARLPAHLPAMRRPEADEPAEEVAGVVGAEGPTPTVELLFFGIVREYKGLDVLVRALARAPEHLRLTVAGEFWEPVERYGELARSLGVEGRVELRPGYVPAGELADLLAGADVLVLPYVSATGSQNVDLALSAGLPVVATDAGALAEAVVHGVNGLVVAPNDVEALASTLTEVSEPHRLDVLRQGARDTKLPDEWPGYVGTLLALAADEGPAVP